jgi:hypothetical protein
LDANFAISGVAASVVSLVLGVGCGYQLFGIAGAHSYFRDSATVQSELQSRTECLDRKTFCAKVVEAVKHQQWDEAISLWETDGLRLARIEGFRNPRRVNEYIAQTLIMQGKYPEARVLMEAYMSHERVPPGFCHNDYNRRLRVLMLCRSKTSLMTQEQLNETQRCWFKKHPLIL